jgi:hypothetical protein
VISPDGDAAMALLNLDVVVAANPSAETFRKVRLDCSLDTEFSWKEWNLVSIVRMILEKMGSGNERKLE